VADAHTVPVAVIGMACRLPGGIDSPDEFWDALLRGDDLITDIPSDRWDPDEFYDPEPGVPGRSVSRWGGFLDDVMGFDAPFFGFGDREAAAMDPQHRLLLETSWEAVEHAGIAPASLAGSSTGVFMGLSHEDYTVVAHDAGALQDAYGYPGTTFSMASGRIAYWLGLRGPAMTVDSACSTGLLTVHLASRSLQFGESDLALAGGCLVMLTPDITASASALGMLSPTGRCRAFDAGADGFVRSEGCAVVLLKRLPDAVADGDRILAVVRGTAANQDGRTKTISRPSLDAQVEVYRAALANAGVDAATVGMVEAHGTGTRVGDPIEFGSLSSVYGADGEPCALGSVKSNLGHTECAAGTVGMIKAILAMRHGVVPPVVHFTRLPDELARIETGLFVPQAITPWPGGDGQAPRRAAVSSYGVTGTNVHAIVEQAPECAAPDDTPARPAMGDPLLFPLSSTSPDELRRTARRLADWLAARGHQVAPWDLAYTLARRRAHRPVRTTVLASSPSELAGRLRGVAEGGTPYSPAVGQNDRGPVWVFSGQGSQWAGMGASLLAAEPAFAARVAEAEPLVMRQANFSVTEAMSAPETVTGIERVQPVLFTMQVALAAAMASYGVRPGAVIGHSLGEVAAAVVAEALSLEDGVRVICRRSRLLSRIAGAGAMASVELPARHVREELAARGIGDVVVSVVASPESTVVGGAAPTVRALVAAWERRDVMAREVAVDVASHSPAVDPILAELEDELAGLVPMTPSVPYCSATLDDPHAKPTFDAGYWVDNLRQPVRFSAAVQAALDDGHRVFAELSPHPLLTRAVEQTAAASDASVHALAALRRDDRIPQGLREFVGQLHCAGAEVDFSVWYPSGRLVDAPLPTWTHRQLLVASDDQGGRAHGAHTIAVHPLLGAHVRLPEDPERHAWQGDLGTAALPWLADHQINAVPVFPAAGYCEMALATARTVFGADCEAGDLRFEDLLILDAQSVATAEASLPSPGAADFVVETDQDGERTRRASAVLRAAPDVDPPAGYDVTALRAAHPRIVEGSVIRKELALRGIQYGPAFEGLVASGTAHEQTGSVLAEVRLPGILRSQSEAYVVHPALLDACFQSIAAHAGLHGGVDGGLLVPLHVRRLRVHGCTRTARYCYARITDAGAAGIEADLDVLDEHGTVLLTVAGLQLGTGLSESGRCDRVLAERLLTLDWQQQPLPPESDRAPGQWLLITTGDAPEAGDPLARRLTDALTSRGAELRTLHWPQDADHAAAAEQLGADVRDADIDGVVVVCASAPAAPRGLGEEDLLRAREHVRHLVRIARELPELSAQPPRLYVVTTRAQIVASDDRPNLEHGGLRGLLRVIGAEHPGLRPTQIDLDDVDDPFQVARELLSGSDDDETAWRGGTRYIARLRPSPLRTGERRTTTLDNGRDGMRLEVRYPGDLETLEPVAFDRRPPGPGQLEVGVASTSVNFADVLAALGRQPSTDGRRPQLGIDFAGVVTAVGSDVTAHRVGDHVVGFAGPFNGCWGTFVTCDARLVVTVPPGLTSGEAAAVSTVYGTAWYGLHDTARIRSGDRVLIHSGAGGVGQAAIAIARLAGAEVFATAGSPQRRALLRDMGVDHVYDSRTTEFADQIRRDTDGYGVDIVLNSLIGAAQRAGLELLADGGRFVEIGKRDIYGDTRLGLYPFRRNLTFGALDLARMCETHPGRIHDLLVDVFGAVADGRLPVVAHRSYPLDQAVTAIRVMSAAEHTGKLLLEVPRTGRGTVVVPPQRVPIYRRDGAYVVTGGLGGIGLYLAARMAEAGCGRIVLTARSNPTPKAQRAIERIRATGADIVVECGNIADAETATRVVAAATATGLPVRGVLHAAAVVKDATLTNITDELIDGDWAPKVYGAWHLHNATATQPLDWFCSFSSAAALVGSAGQGAYAAANSWLDAFTGWQRSQGIPATAIAWGAWGEIGRATFLADGGRTTMITPEEGAHAFEALVRHDRSFAGYAPLVGSPWLASLLQRSPFAEAFQTAGEQHPADTATLRAELQTLPPDEWLTRLRHLVAEQTSLILRRAVDPDQPFADHGLDSLGNLELRTRIETETGIRITPRAIATHNTARTLAKHLSDTLATDLTV
jgi:acyl transferase domain-containing protein/NADPH:quinone reductase-like Zn-dependent oxidoreductase/NAD(P)-dependent dehydrogenase (short-subunit alcohol dehydrogenase family)/acyl carrier protein